MSGGPSTAAQSSLAGQYQLRPGHAQPIEGTRPIVGADSLSVLLRGLDKPVALQRLGHVFTLCGHAHQRAGRLVFDAARAGARPVATDVTAGLMLLRWETLRDHLRAMALDWPQRLGKPGEAPPLAWLQTCSLPLAGAASANDHAAGAAIQALKVWLENSVLGMAAEEWLAAHQDADALAQWCLQYAARHGSGEPTGMSPAYPVLMLAHWSERAARLQVHLHGLDVLDDNAAVQQRQMKALALAIAAAPGFVQSPVWHGAAAETGPWTRLRHRRGVLGSAARSASHSTAWTRLASRWMELVSLAAAPALPDAAAEQRVVRSGALSLGDGQAVAWCEMARGLLLHWAQLDDAGRVQHYRVLAPTEWNFHPHGALATALAGLGADDTASAQLLAAAFDPCVECTILADQYRERAHA